MGYTNFNPNASNTKISSTPSFFGGYEPKSYEDESGAKEAAPSESGSGMDTWRYGSPSNIRNWQTNQSQGGNGGGGGSRKPMGSTSESSVTFEGEAPKAPKVAKLELPKFDKRAVRALTQKHAAPAMRKLSEGLQTALNVQSDNPNVRRMTLREALQGYGTGLEQAMSGAGTQARQEHQQELEQTGREAQMNWQAQNQAAMQAYNNAFQKYLASATRTQTTSYDDESDSGPGSRDQAFASMWNTVATFPSY